MDAPRQLHIIHLLIRNQRDGEVCFLVYPHDKWPYETLPAKKTIEDLFAPFRLGSSLEHFLEELLEKEFKLAADDYALEQELPPVVVEMPHSPSHVLATRYTIFPLDVWVEPSRRQQLQETVSGRWLTCNEALAEPRLSPTTADVFQALLHREAELTKEYAQHPEAERQAETPRRLFGTVPDRPTMEALARKWLHANRGGVRHLPKAVLDEILGTGTRAFNLRVADPYLRYQMQGVGFTWSFFTHKRSAGPARPRCPGSGDLRRFGVPNGSMVEAVPRPRHVCLVSSRTGGR
jgi:hypothetical protein